MTPVTFYTKNNCPQCKATKMILEAKKIEYTERNIDENDGYRLEAQATGFFDAPIIVPSPDSGIKSWSWFKPDELKKLI